MDFTGLMGLTGFKKLSTKLEMPICIKMTKSSSSNDNGAISASAFSSRMCNVKLTDSILKTVVDFYNSGYAIEVTCSGESGAEACAKLSGALPHAGINFIDYHD